MKLITIEETAGILEASTIINTVDLGSSIIHKLKLSNGNEIVLINGGANGESVIVKLG